MSLAKVQVRRIGRPGLWCWGCKPVSYAASVFYPHNFSSARGRQTLFACSRCWVQRRQNLKFRVDWHLTLAPPTSHRRSFA